MMDLVFGSFDNLSEGRNISIVVEFKNNYKKIKKS
jgi:hypothetical protein